MKNCPHCGGELPPEQLDLFDVPGSWDAPTREAIERVERGTDPEWRAAAEAAIEEAALMLPLLTPDDLWDRVERPREPRAAGPVWLWAAKTGLVEKTGRLVRSRNSLQHGNVILEYRSLVHRNGDGPHTRPPGAPKEPVAPIAEGAH